MAKEETRQSTKENLRLFLLDSFFQQDRFYTKEELVAKLEVSVPTLDRDLRRLRDDYSAPLEYSKTIPRFLPIYMKTRMIWKLKTW